ncbi:uncharacterized protein ACA1_020790 [Acanthamoeba castellanii str. Neff]|uniref:Uncharacterized protein n=1 Tax=Acanthamoeba castellanii (strain ATCC 30010 / Neff) TaxID=1257118 RepID=L8GUZ0_ACACF|nr:uncharacterized protein ACA1_020790 [Acanthamoeba castellanii str. Neff]ELR16438.1 hypothetical protein ACA1_020790 [Acanthamoeba castellanii str. Neff]
MQEVQIADSFMTQLEDLVSEIETKAQEGRLDAIDTSALRKHINELHASVSFAPNYSRLLKEIAFRLWNVAIEMGRKDLPSKELNVRGLPNDPETIVCSFKFFSRTGKLWSVSQPSVLRILHLYANNLVEKLWQRIEAEFSEQAAEGEVQQMLFMFFISQYVVT